MPLQEFASIQVVPVILLRRIEEETVMKHRSKLRFEPVWLAFLLAFPPASHAAGTGSHGQSGSGHDATAPVAKAASAMPISVCPPALERYLPGDHYFCAGSNRYARGHYSRAVSLYESAAAWGDKRAQFNLGLMYFRGDHILVDKPLGLAWLALSAERKSDALHREVLAEYYRSVSPQVRHQADALWNRMKLKYADKIARARALKRYDRESAHIRRAAQRDPFVIQYIAGLGYGDITHTLQGLDDRATHEFGRNGEVTVGDLTVVDDAKVTPISNNKSPQTPSNP